MDWKKLMKLTIIEAPLKDGDAYLKLCIEDCFNRDEAPFSADGFYRHHLDQKVMTQRAKTISAGLEWARYADVIAFYIDHGITETMQAHIKIYEAAHKKIEYRKLLS